MLLHLLTWPEVETYLHQSRGIIVPIGSTEQHGPIGLIGTDAICAEIVARAIGETASAMVAPTLPIGMAQHHLAFPGSISLRPSTLIAMVRDCVASLVRHGFQRFYFINGHGGNIATLSAAFSEIYAEVSLKTPDSGSGIKCRLKNWWQAPRVMETARELFGDGEGSHATPSEISLTWFAYPQTAQLGRTLEPKIAPRGTFADADDYRRNFPDGRIGSDSALASVEAGKQIFDLAVEGLSADYRNWLADA